MKKSKEETAKLEILDVRKSSEERRRVGRIIKNANFARGSKYIPNTPQTNKYRYKRKID